MLFYFSIPYLDIFSIIYLVFFSRTTFDFNNIYSNVRLYTFFTSTCVQENKVSKSHDTHGYHMLKARINQDRSNLPLKQTKPFKETTRFFDVPGTLKFNELSYSETKMKNNTFKRGNKIVIQFKILNLFLCHHIFFSFYSKQRLYVFSRTQCLIRKIKQKVN